MQSNDKSAMSGSVLLSLSLFIILLAFFIILNAISNFSEPKVNAAFDSLDLAFDTKLLSSEMKEDIMSPEQEQEDGEGDSLEDMQNVLRSILPGLDINLQENPNGGKVMAIRIKKDMFDRLESQLVPVLYRIMMIKDNENDYELAMTSYVRNTLSASSRKSHNAILGYKDNLAKMGVDPSRVTLSLALGNPAFMMLQFNNVEEPEE